MSQLARAGRYDHIYAERGGDPAPATPPAPAGTALGVLTLARQVLPAL